MASNSWTVLPAPANADKVIPRRRGTFNAIPSVSVGAGDAEIGLEEAWAVGDALFEAAGLPQYKGMMVGEQPALGKPAAGLRQLPNAYPDTQLAKLNELFERLGSYLYGMIKAGLVPPYQTYDIRTKLGFPEFRIVLNKLQVLLPYFGALLRGDLSMLTDAFVIMNIRLQVDPREKKREYDFLHEGAIVTRTWGEAERTDKRYNRLTSRVRLVYNYPLSNLLTQFADTAVHNWFLRSRTFHHDMTQRIGQTLPGYVFALDVKHFERAVGIAVRWHAKLMGGLYGEILNAMLLCPTLITDTHGSPHLLRLNPGYVMQLGSGVSCVAPIAKVVLTLIYAAFIMSRVQCSPVIAIQKVLDGGIPGLNILNYGDDNLLYGDERLVKECVAFISDYLPTEEEDPPKFLGYEYTSGGFYLAPSSYITKFHLPERAPYGRFRPYPMLGWSEKRKVYSKQGDTRVNGIVVPKERELLEPFGYTDFLIDEAAKIERQRALDHGEEKYMTNPLYLIDKEYLLTEEERARSPLFNTVRPEVTRQWLDILLGRKS